MQNIIIFFSLLMTALAAKLPTMTESTSVAHPLFNRNTEGTNCTSELYEPTLNYTMCSVGDYVDMGSTHCGIGDAANVNDCTVMLDAMHDYANATGGGGFYGMSNTSIHTVAWVGNCRFTVEPSTSDAGWHVLLGVYVSILIHFPFYSFKLTSSCFYQPHLPILLHT